MPDPVPGIDVFAERVNQNADSEDANPASPSRL
jgi:hypothetical protein